MVGALFTVVFLAAQKFEPGMSRRSAKGSRKLPLVVRMLEAIQLIDGDVVNQRPVFRLQQCRFAGDRDGLTRLSRAAKECSMRITRGVAADSVRPFRVEPFKPLGR